jgi:hypothetical protein
MLLYPKTEAETMIYGVIKKFALFDLQNNYRDALAS